MTKEEAIRVILAMPRKKSLQWPYYMDWVAVYVDDMSVKFYIAMSDEGKPKSRGKGWIFRRKWLERHDYI